MGQIFFPDPVSKSTAQGLGRSATEKGALANKIGVGEQLLAEEETRPPPIRPRRNQRGSAKRVSKSLRTHREERHPPPPRKLRASSALHGPLRD